MRTPPAIVDGQRGAPEHRPPLPANPAAWAASIEKRAPGARWRRMLEIALEDLGSLQTERCDAILAAARRRKARRERRR